MLNAQLLPSRLVPTLFAVALLAAFAPAASAQSLPAVHVGDTQITGLPDDWSHHRVVFSDPGTEKDAIRRGNYDQWLKTVNDPRYVLSRLKQGRFVEGPAAQDVRTRHLLRMQDRRGSRFGDRDPRGGTSGSSTAMHRDWSMDLGSGANLAPGHYPAKYNFDYEGDISSAACSDYIVFPTSNAGAGTQAEIVGYNNLYAGTCYTGAQTGPSIAWAYNTGGATASLSPVLSWDGAQIAYMQVSNNAASLVLLKPAQTPGSFTTTAALTAGSKTISGVSGFTAADIGMQIADTTHGCIPANDTITAVAGNTITLASAVSATYYYRGTNYSCSTSVTLSASAETAVLPGVPVSVTNANYRACTAPCYTTIPLSDGANDSNSAPYYDYPNDVMYVGDNSAVLHKFSGVFFGTPAEVTGGGTSSGWPQTMTGGGTLTSPVLDSSSGTVFVAGSGGYLYRVPATGGSNNIIRSSQIATGGSTGVVDSPVVDSTPAIPMIYVFVGDYGGSNAVYRFTNNFGAGTSGSHVTFGSATASTNLYDGDFDNIYYSGSGSTGYLYACGYYHPNSSYRPNLYRISMSSFNTANSVASLTSASATCSPITEFANGGSDGSAVTTLSARIANTSQTSISVASGSDIQTNDYIQIDSEIMLVSGGGGTNTLTVTRHQLGTTATAHAANSGIQIPGLDWLFLSVTAYGSDTGCTGTSSNGCVYSYYLDSAGDAPSAATAGLISTGGTSGISIDNSSLSSGASQIYYTTLSNQSCDGNGTTGNGTGGCAVQASQSGLN